MSKVKGNVDERKARTLDVWLNNPMLSFNEIAEKAGISYETFFRYRQDKAFMEEYDRRCREWFAALKAKAIETMVIGMENGKTDCAKYILDAADFGGVQKVDVTANNIKITIEE